MSIADLVLVGDRLVIAVGNLVMVCDLGGVVRHRFSLAAENDGRVRLGLHAVSPQRIVAYGTRDSDKTPLAPVVIDVDKGAIIGRCALGERTGLTPIPTTSSMIAMAGEAISLVDFAAMTRSAPTPVPGIDRLVATTGAVVVSPLAPGHVGAPVVLRRTTDAR